MKATLALILLVNWTGPVRITTPADPLTDKRQIYAIVGDPKHHLAMGCDVEGSRDLQVVLKFGRYIGTAVPGILAGGQELRYRFDQAAADSVRWFSSDDTITAPGDKTKPLRFIRQMRGTGTVLVRTLSPAGEPYEMRFNYSASEAALDEMLRRCGTEAPAGAAR